MTVSEAEVLRSEPPATSSRQCDESGGGYSGCYESVNDTSAERIEGRTSDEVAILTVMRRKGRALTTERGYVRAYRDFVRHSGLSSGTEIKAEQVKSYLSYLAMAREVASSTQKGALNALVFIAQTVFGVELGDIGDFVHAKNRKKIPTVMSKGETRRFFAKMKGEKRLMAHLEVRQLFELDLEDDGLAGVYLPAALARKHRNAGKDWRWQWLWPSRQISTDPRGGLRRRHHVLPNAYQRAVRDAGKRAGLTKRVTSHTLRHSFCDAFTG